MKLKLLQAILWLLGLVCFIGHANNDKYRLILVDNPATTITVAWNQISGTSPTVYYDIVDHGTDHTLYAFSKTVDRTTDFRGMSNQFARLSSLNPNTDYYFVIHDSEGTSQRFWFRTAPADNSRLSFIAGGDSRNNRTPRQNANKLVSKLKPHAVFFGGDMTDDDTSIEWQNWFDDWQLTTTADGRMFPIVPARGNHEYNPETVFNLFDTPNSDSYFAFTWGNNLIRTYTLNTEISILGDQLTWLQNDLASNTTPIWKSAQYHKPMRPHTSGKSEGRAFQYESWAQLFYDEGVRLVVDCDSHMAKTTWPVKPSFGPNSEEGFEIDLPNGTVYTGEGSWGAPLRPNDDDKIWTRSSGSFNQFKVIFVDEQRIELRTVIVDNADSVAEGSHTDPFTLPANLDVFSPPTGDVVIISNDINNPCTIAGTVCDDGDSNTLFDEEDGFCNCEGLLDTDLIEETVSVAQSSDDAEENSSTQIVDITSTDLELINDTDDQLVGIRFNNVQMPIGSTLYRAYIEFTTDETDSSQDPTNLLIEGELVPNSDTFTTDTANISSRVRTSNTVTWSEIPIWDTEGVSGLEQRTPYITAIVNEIVSQNDWASGNAISFIFSGTGKRVAESFDGSAAPRLKLFYQLPCEPAGTICDDGNPTTVLDVEDGSCNCVGFAESDDLDYQVVGGDNDAEEAETTGIIYTNSSDLELVFDSFENQNNQTVGIRFVDIAIPQGAIITSADIQFTTDETDSEPTDLQIRGELVPNSDIFNTVDFNISSRPTTEAVVPWLDVPEWNLVGEAGAAQRTPQLRSIVQEIVDQANWQPFNAMSFIITGSGSRAAESNNGSQSDAPRLLVSYTLSDSCPVYGTPCDDGDSSTINDEEDGFCNCQGIPDTSVQNDFSILSSNDDAEEDLSNGAVDVTSSDLELINDGTDQLVGVRFDNVQLPEGATLHRAYIQFETDETDSELDPTNLIITGELSESSLAFDETVVNDISNRALTISTVNWDEVPLWETVGEAGISQRTPYLTSIVSEIAAQANWTSGNAMTFLISGSGKRVAESQDGSGTGPRLILFYTSPCNPAGMACDDGDETTFFDLEDGFCNCTGIAQTGTLNYPINASNNDAEERVSDGDMSLTSTDLELVDESGTDNQLVGLRFTDIQLPADASILNAYIQFTVDNDNTDVTNLVIETELDPNSEEFTAEVGNISARARGLVSVNWDNVPAWTTDDIGAAGPEQQTPNLSGLIGEVLADDNWDLLKSLTFIISGTGEREAESIDGSAAPILVIEYQLNNLSIEDNQDLEQIKVFPIPATHTLKITSPIQLDAYKVRNMLGQAVLNGKPEDLDFSVDIQGLNSGIYFIEMHSGNLKRTVRFIKK
ncbi:fibronectin type III domain-containing protein [Winogradskyella sp.]|uniref:fibronectin type III domain-containing protein n=1 Tax=Winogradskyella sp. TaxID=1883156 RepID=UPI00263861B9|nr:fibronectin type III domain-containing protein [Winogradskyella sp.]